MSKGWRSQTLKDNLQLADKYLLEPAKEAKCPNPGCLNCLTTCKSNNLYAILTSRCSSREQPADQPKVQEIAVALSYMENSRQKYGMKICPISNAVLEGMIKRFYYEFGAAENRDFESKINTCVLGGARRI